MRGRIITPEFKTLALPDSELGLAAAVFLVKQLHLADESPGISGPEAMGHMLVAGSAKDLATHRMYAALHKNQVIAAALAVIANDGSNKLALLQFLAVHEKYEKRGIGSALLLYCETELAADGASRAVLGCEDELVSFYENRGYAMTDSELMTKQLTKTASMS